MNHWKICFIVAALAATPTTSIVFAEDDVSPAATLRANAQALLTKPDARAESVYNAGVNMYRAGEFELAGELFAAAASKCGSFRRRIRSRRSRQQWRNALFRFST